ncbi:MAG: hypothetical protein M3O28_15440, partial [Actinomycetota bacterium]|nr:hypothetical protein [Actinomycetota bacterium]
MRATHVLAACVLALLFVAPGVGAAPASAASAVPGTSVPPAYTASNVIQRTQLDAAGKETKNGKQYNVSVAVDQISNLQGRQDINVRWSGAPPTGGIQPDPNSTAAPDQEYPMVILECRGTPAQVNPSTCWTHGADARYQGVSFTSFGPWRLDRYAAAADRAAVVGRPSAIPASNHCPAAAANERWWPFVGVGGTTYNYGNNSCDGLPPEDFNFDSSQQAVPQNSTFAVTGTDGTGSAKFDVWTEAQNASLGCTATVACTLEVIPITGISCDPYGVSPDSAPLPATDVPTSDDRTRATPFCEAGGNYLPGQLATISNSANTPVSGALWWSGSNWRNRFAVPLNFAPVSQACNVVNGGAPVNIYGSELMTEATSQWTPYFCTRSDLFKLGHVATSEPLAERLAQDPTSGVHAAFTSLSPPGGFSSPTVQAPVAVTGFAISYAIDDSGGNSVGTLKLTPRLLAKLLTQSYTGDDFSRFGENPYGSKTFADQNGNSIVEPYLGHNPVNIADDPEFKALNPGISAPNATPGAATLIEVSEETDVTSALTSYIKADPEAMAWLGGQSDPWGMVVNPYYATTLKEHFQTAPLSLPLPRWPLLDLTVPTFGGVVPCNTDPANASPWLPLIASPTPNFATTALDVQFAAPPSKVKCSSLSGIPGASDVQWSSTGRATPGQRFVIGITSLSAAKRYDLNTAELQTQSTASPTARFLTADGRTFVGPTGDALQAAARLFSLDKATHTWTLPYSMLHSSSGQSAYPGTMIVNADVPTSGLPPALATNYSKLLNFAAGIGQTPGAANGELPAGYLPMTAANGLAAEVAYTQSAASAVAAQQCVVPDVSAACTLPPKASSRAGNPGTAAPAAGVPAVV